MTHPSEAYILGTLMNFGEGLELCDKLDSRHFADGRHARVWQAIRELFDDGKPYTADCVHAVLHRDGVLEDIGGAMFLADLSDSGVSPVTLHVHTATLVNRMLVRQVSMVADKIAAEANEQAEAGSLIEIADREFTALQMQRESRHEVKATEMVRDVMKNLQARHENGGLVGLSTGFPGLDQMTNGLQDGALIILAARPAMGKTAFALNMAAALSVEHRHPVAFFSLEMGANELGTRMVTARSRVPTAKVFSKAATGADWTRIAIATSDIGAAPLTIVDSSLLTVHELRSHARKLRAQNKLRVLVIDYLQLMSGDAETREREIGEISRGLKMLAKELGVPVIALSQLNRGVESRGEKRPTLADLRDSGSIEQDADTVWFLFREEVYDKETDKKGTAEVIVAKNRNGPVGTVHLRFDPNTQRFTDAMIP